jgi:hypothetical protein
VRLERLGKLTSSGLESATFRLAAQRLNHLLYRSPYMKDTVSHTATYVSVVIKTLSFILAFQLQHDKLGNVPDKDSLFVAVLETWRPGAQ